MLRFISLQYTENTPLDLCNHEALTAVQSPLFVVLDKDSPEPLLPPEAKLLRVSNNTQSPMSRMYEAAGAGYSIVVLQTPDPTLTTIKKELDGLEAFLHNDTLRLKKEYQIAYQNGQKQHTLSAHTYSRFLLQIITTPMVKKIALALMVLAGLALMALAIGASFDVVSCTTVLSSVGINTAIGRTTLSIFGFFCTAPALTIEQYYTFSQNKPK